MCVCVCFALQGLKEGVLQMTAGSKFELYVPYTLGFGDGGLATLMKNIVHPKAVLIYTIELLKIERSHDEL